MGGGAGQASPWVSVALVLASGGVALMSAWIGSILTRRNTHRQWVIDQRLKVYTQAVTAASELMSEIDRTWVNRSAMSQSERSVALNVKISEMYAASAAITLVAPYAVTHTMAEFMEQALDRLLPASRYSSLSEREWTRARDDTSSLHRRLVTVLRDDLRIPRR